MYRYSQRLSWSEAPNPFSTLLAEIRASGRPFLDLTVSNPTDALAAYPHAEIAAAFADLADFSYQPEPFGNWRARSAIVRRIQSRFPELRLSPEHVLLTASTSEGYALLFKLLADPADEVLVPTPSYPLFDFLGKLESVKLTPYRLAYDGSWHIDFESIEAAISLRTRAIILVNPNNPTGSFLKIAEFERLRALALKHSLPLISDEVFMDYAFDESPGRVPTLMGRNQLLSFSLNGLSKAAAMPQMKLGWIVVNGPAADRDAACAHLELLLDTYLSVGTPVQLAAEKLLAIGDATQASIRLRTRQNRVSLNELLQNSDIHMLHAEGGWSAVLRVPNVLTEEEWITRLLVEQSVLVQPGYFFDMPGEAYLVVSLLTEEKTLAEGIRRLKTLTRS